MKSHAFFFFFFIFFFQPTSAQPPNHQQQPPYNVNPNFRPSLAVTVAILSAAFVFIALFSFYIRRCSRQTYANRGSFRGVNARSRPAPRGLDPSLIDTFPTFVYSVVKGLKIGKGALECAVCLNEFEDDETLRLLPNCDHVFHPECIDAWLGSHTTCPVCRTDLSLPPQHEPASEVVAEAGATEEAPSGIGSQANAIETDNDSQEQVLISINDQGSQAQVINPNQILSKNRSGRSKSTKTRRFPRSHSTGHSLVHQSENFDRFTLRLPADVRKQIINGKLNRSASCVTFATRQGSVSGSRRGRNPLFGRFDRSGKSDRWGFSMAPPFFWRNPSSNKGESNSVKLPFDWRNSSRKVEGSVKGANPDSQSQQSSTARPPV